MQKITLRKAQAKDVPELLALIGELAAYEKLESEVSADHATLNSSLFGAAPQAYALLAEVNGAVAGFCVYFYNFSTFIGKRGLYIEDIFVRESYRGLGIGKRFFTHLCEIARENDCGRMEWWVLDWNRPALDFYQALGAEPMSDWTVYRLTENKFTALLKAA